MLLAEIAKIDEEMCKPGMAALIKAADETSEEDVFTEEEEDKKEEESDEVSTASNIIEELYRLSKAPKAED